MSFLCSSDPLSAWEQVFTWATSKPLVPYLFILLIAFLPLTLAFWPFLEQLTHKACFPWSVKENCTGSFPQVLPQDTSTSAPIKDSQSVLFSRHTFLCNIAACPFFPQFLVYSHSWFLFLHNTYHCILYIFPVICKLCEDRDFCLCHSLLCARSHQMNA